MLAQRLIVTILLVPVGIFVIAAGGWLLAIVLMAILGYGGWEYWRIYKQGGYNPSAPVLITGVTGLVLARQLFQFNGSDVILAALVLLAMGIQVFRFEKGSTTSAIDFNITLGGILYLGWLGSYLVSLRNLPNGLWWFLLVLPAVWFADGTAYFVGSHFGRHKMSPRVSPNKSWEGYIGGVIGGALLTMLLAGLWQIRAAEITPVKGLVLGLILAVISPLGDLGESMLKRGFGIKDSSHLLPGHGGVMDRIDSWLWSAVIGYYLIIFLWL
jgi:phosphatidate cytidylyltransferase